MQTQPRWTHVPAPPLHAVPASHPLHSQVDCSLSQVNRGYSHDQPLPPNKFFEPRVPTSLGNGKNFNSTVSTSAAVVTSEPVLTDSLKSANTSAGRTIVAQSSSETSGVESSKSSTIDNDRNNNSKNQKHGCKFFQGSVYSEERGIRPTWLFWKF